MVPTIRCCVILLVLIACAGPARAAQSKAFVVGTDFSTGTLSVIDLGTRAVTSDVADVGSDPVVRWYLGLVYVVNRYGGDNIQVIDPAQGYATVRQFSVGNGSNPQDIALVSPTKAYVSRYGSADLLVVNPSDANGAPQASISLAAFADADGLPEMARMIRIGRWLFVACQRLTNFTVTNPAMVVVVDTQADTVLDVDPAAPGRQAITLAGRNPVTSFAFDRATSRLLIGEAGSYGVLDGGIEAIDPSRLRSDGLVIGEAMLGGDLLDVAWSNPSHAYALVSSSSSSELVAWNPTLGTRIGTLHTASGGFGLPDFELDDRGELYVCRNTLAGPGVLVFSTTTDALIAGPLPTGLPPVALTFDQASDEVTGVPGAVGGVAFAGPWPNPARRTARFTVVLDRPSQVIVEAFDPAGRRVRTLTSAPRDAGRSELVWDLADEQGHPVAAGIYLMRARVGERILVRRVAVLP